MVQHAREIDVMRMAVRVHETTTLIISFISIIPDISIAPLQVHYYSEGANDSSIDTVSKRQRQLWVKDYVTVGVGFKTATLRIQGTELTT